MARMIFIVQGEGRGHLSQSVALKEYLDEAGHSLEAVYVGSNPSRKIPDYYRDIFKGKLRSFSSPWFLRTPNKKGIYVGRTLLYNLIRGPLYLKEVRRIRKEISTLRPDVIFNFYDVLGALAMRRLSPDIRRIGIGHHFFLHLDGYRCEGGKHFHRMLLKFHTELIIKSCDQVLALSYRDQKGKGKIAVIPPLVRKQFREAGYEDGSAYLVYLLNEGFIMDIISLSRAYPGLQFDVFSDLPPDTPVPEGISLFRVNDREFSEKMKCCKGVITTAGFDTAAEAACMGVALAVFPVENHFEQVCNSRDVERSGLGIVLKNYSMENLALMKKIDHLAYRKWVDSAARQILMHLSG